MPGSQDWFWEGNVQAVIARTLETDGWQIRTIADTASKARGVDILAELGTRALAVEVKGYPSKGYADPRRVHETKPTNPVNQAGHWFAQAILKGMRMQSAMPGWEIALGLPDFPRYRGLLSETQHALERLGIGVYIVSEAGGVSVFLATNPASGPVSRE